MKKLISLFLILAASIQTWAADMGPAQRACSTVDLRRDLGPVRNQGNVGWCYANAAADLLSHRFRKELKGHQVSAIAVALEYNANLFFMDSLGEGGSSALAVLTYLKSSSRHNSLCLQAAEDQLMNSGLDQGLKQKLEALQKLKRLYDLQAKDGKQFQSFYSHWKKLKDAGSILFTLPEQTLTSILQNSDTDDFPLKVKQALCRNRSITVNAQDVGVSVLSHWLPFVSQKDVVSEINDQLNQRNILGVSYYASILESAATPAKTGTEHASVLAGRKWNEKTNTCEYLVRNFWGSGCYEGAYKNKNIRCEAGYFWIRESDLKKSMFAATYLEARTDLKFLRSTLSILE